MAKIIIDGNASGAERSLQQSTQGLRRLAEAGRRTSTELQRGAQGATRSQKEFAAAVERAEQRLQRQRRSALAASAARRRLGLGEELAGADGPSGWRQAGRGGRLLAQAGALGGGAGAAASGLGLMASMGPAAAAVLAFGFALRGAQGVVERYKKAKEDALAAEQLAGRLGAERRRAQALGAIEEHRQRGPDTLLARAEGRDPGRLIGPGLGRDAALVLDRALAGIENQREREQVREAVGRASQVVDLDPEAAAQRVLQRLRRRSGMFAGAELAPPSSLELAHSAAGRADLSVSGLQALLQGLVTGSASGRAVREGLAGLESAQAARLDADPAAIREELARQRDAITAPGAQEAREALEANTKTLAEMRAALVPNTAAIQRLEATLRELQQLSGGYPGRVP